MKQYTENQYDDDLTVGADDYDDSYYTDVDDLFAFTTDDESQISRLKSLILSIDWEITDDVLMQFNDELVDLRGIWAGEKINLVYVQALEKISKYIYQKKVESHPSAIKLLLTLYHNLEKIVSSPDLSDKEKKEILLKDVKKFENLKREIGKTSQEVVEPEAVVEPKRPESKEDAVVQDELLNLRAIVLGIDWEITDKDLNELRQEVQRLEEKFTANRPRCLLLQGIGTLGAYIKLKKSDSHADAFKVLHLFYESLEKITLTSMGREEEKAILLPAVEAFNSFKIQLGTTISDEAISRNEEESDEDPGSFPVDAITPAFADIPEEKTRGFQAEEEAQALGLDNSGNVGPEIDTFFADESLLSPRPSSHVSDDDAETVAIEEMIGGSAMFAGADEAESAALSIAKEVALEGVDVEEDDDEKPADRSMSGGGDLAPALSFEDEDSEELRDPLAGDNFELKEEIDSPVETFKDLDPSSHLIDENENEELGRDFSLLDRAVALQGVDVETEADEDGDEEALPMSGEDVAPALAENDEVSIYNVDLLEKAFAKEKASEEIVGNLNGFFDEKIETPVVAIPGEAEDDNCSVALVVESDEDETVEDAIIDSEPILDAEKTDSIDLEDPMPALHEEDGDDGNVALVVESDEDEIVEDAIVDSEPILDAEKADSIDLEDPMPALHEEDEDDGNVALVVESDEDEIVEDGIVDSTPLLDAQNTVTVDSDEPQEPGEFVLVPEDDEEVVLELKEQETSGEDEAETALFEEISEEINLVPESSQEVDDRKNVFAVDDELELNRFGSNSDDDLFGKIEPDASGEEEPEEEVPAELEQQLDSFFDIEETVEAPEEESVFLVIPETDGEDVPASEMDVPALALGGMEAEEEVVFELAEEDEPLSSALNGFAESDNLAELSENVETDAEIDQDPGALESLRTHVESLEVELDSKALEGIFQEIDILRQVWSDKPVEKTFLQLLFTVTKHIDNNRQHVNGESYSLLKSVWEALNGLQAADQHQNQKQMLVEVCRVLDWQQGMLVQQNSKLGEKS